MRRKVKAIAAVVMATMMLSSTAFAASPTISVKPEQVEVSVETPKVSVEEYVKEVTVDEESAVEVSAADEKAPEQAATAITNQVQDLSKLAEVLEEMAKEESEISEVAELANAVKEAATVSADPDVKTTVDVSVEIKSVVNIEKKEDAEKETEGKYAGKYVVTLTVDKLTGAKDTYVVVLHNHDNKWDMIIPEVDGKDITFAVEDFSDFAIMEMKVEKTEETVKKPEDNTNNNSGSSSSNTTTTAPAAQEAPAAPKTGAVAVFPVLGALCMAGTVACGKKLKKND